MAVIDGNVMAINPGEETRMQMFIWNNIFFSLGFDVRDHYRELGGDAAAHAAPTNDLNGVRAYGAVDVEGLYTLGTVVVDYRGYRVTAQSIIPGILEREQEQSVIYGSIDFGKTVVPHNKYLELLDKTSRPLKVSRLDETSVSKAFSHHLTHKQTLTDHLTPPETMWKVTIACWYDRCIKKYTIK